MERARVLDFPDMFRAPEEMSLDEGHCFIQVGQPLLFRIPLARELICMRKFRAEHSLIPRDGNVARSFIVARRPRIGKTANGKGRFFRVSRVSSSMMNLAHVSLGARKYPKGSNEIIITDVCTLASRYARLLILPPQRSLSYQRQK